MAAKIVHVVTERFDHCPNPAFLGIDDLDVSLFANDTRKYRVPWCRNRSETSARGNRTAIAYTYIWCADGQSFRVIKSPHEQLCRSNKSLGQSRIQPITNGSAQARIQARIDPRFDIRVHSRKLRWHVAPHPQYTPTVVVAAISWNGRTPLTPCHGYFADGASRSPSSRSANRGTKNSFVRVVRRTRPVPPTGTCVL